MASLVWILRIVGVIALLCIASALATPRGRLPLALRGLRRIMQRDGLAKIEPTEIAKISPSRKFFAFLLILFAIVLCVV